MNLRQSFTLLGVLGALGAVGCSGDDDTGDSGGAGGGAGSTGGGTGASGGSSAVGGSAGTGAASGMGGSGATGGSAAGVGGATAGKGGGGSAGLSGAPDIDPSTPTDELTADEKAELCDWTQNLRGGYGMSVNCGNQQGSKTFDSQAQCVAVGFLHGGCDPTAGMWSACQIALVPDMGCSTPPACAAILDC